MFTTTTVTPTPQSSSRNAAPAQQQQPQQQQKQDTTAPTTADAQPVADNKSKSKNSKTNIDAAIETEVAATASTDELDRLIKVTAWPAVDVDACNQKLGAQSRKPFEQCVSALSLEAHTFYAPLHRIWQRGGGGGGGGDGDNPFFARLSKEQRAMFDKLLTVVAKEQSMYHSRVADLVLRCRGCASDAAAAAAGSSSSSEHVCENHNFFPKHIAACFSGKEQALPLSAGQVINHVLQNGTKVGECPARAVLVDAEKTRAPVVSQVLGFSSTDDRRRTVAFSEPVRIFSPPLHLDALKNTHAATATPTASSLDGQLLAQSNKQPTEVCFTLSALETLASSSALAGSAPRFAIGGRILRGGAAGAFAVFDQPFEHDGTIHRKTLVQLYYQQLVQQHDEIFIDGGGNIGNNSALVRVELADVIALKQQQQEAEQQQGKRRRQQQQQPKKQQNTAAPQPLATTSFLLHVPLMGRKRADGSPVVLLVKPEYSTKGVDNGDNAIDNAADFRLERFSAHEVLFMMLVLRCVPRASVQVVRVNAYSSSVLAVENISTPVQLDALIKQQKRNHEFLSVFSILSSTVSYLHALVRDAPVAAGGNTINLIIVRQVDATSMSFVQHDDDDDHNTSSVVNAKRVEVARATPAQLRKMVLPVDSWLRPDLLQFCFAPSENINRTTTEMLKRSGDLFTALHATVVFDSSAEDASIDNAAAAAAAAGAEDSAVAADGGGSAAAGGAFEKSAAAAAKVAAAIARDKKRKGERRAIEQAELLKNKKR